MKRLLILPIISLLGATAFSTGLFSQAGDANEIVPEPFYDLVEKISDDNSTDADIPEEVTEAPVIDDDSLVTDEDDQSILTEQSHLTVTRRPAMLSGAVDRPLTSEMIKTTEPETTEAPETEAPVTTTKAPETTKAPQTTKAPETSKAPVVNSTTDQAKAIVAIAKGEIGITEAPTNVVKYNDWFYGARVSGSGYPWCGAFIAWCANQAGISTDVIPAYASTTLFQSFYKNQGRYFAYSSGYTPKEGDLIFFDWDGYRSGVDHVGIVISCKDGVITTVEGNYSDKVSCNTYTTYNANIAGYASPNYK